MRMDRRAGLLSTKKESLTFEELFSSNNIVGYALTGRNSSSLSAINITLTSQSWYVVGDTYYAISLTKNSYDFAKIKTDTGSLTITHLSSGQTGLENTVLITTNGTTGIKTDTTIYGGEMIVFKFQNTYSISEIDNLFKNATTKVSSGFNYYNSAYPSTSSDGSLFNITNWNTYFGTQNYTAFVGFYGANGFNFSIFSTKNPTTNPIFSIIGGSKITTRTNLMLTTISSTQLYAPSTNGSSVYRSYRSCCAVFLLPS